MVGVRAFNTNPRMPRFHQKLMDYVSAGGTLVVQYNTQNRISKIVGQIGPWPFNISQDRVTDETAAVTLLEPEHALLHVPNRIVRARLQRLGPGARTLLRRQLGSPLHAAVRHDDPDESPRRRDPCCGPLWKGSFVYTGLAFFRQLPAGVPGAYRLFANLLAHGH